MPPKATANIMPIYRHPKTHTIDADAMPRLLRDALAHLYDASHLQTHPLGQLLTLDTSGGATSQGQALRRLLLEAIESMRPGDQVPYSDKTWRPYRVLTHRYAQRMSVLETQAEMGISERQLQREHAHALRNLTSILQPNLVQTHETRGKTSPREDPYDSAIERFLSRSRPEPLGLDEIIGSVVSDLQTMARQRRIDIEVTSATLLDPLYGDRGVMRQIVLSALAHALDCAGDAKLIVTLETTVRDAIVRLTWADRDSSTSFRVRARAPLPHRLALAERMTKALCGNLVADDKEIILTVPLSRQIILAVDDNRDMVDMLTRFLADGRYKVIGALSGQEALEMAPELDPHVILLDVMMPSQDGWEVLQHLKHSPATAHIPVVICSILPEQQLAETLGADGYLAKPVTQQALFAMLQQTASNAQSYREQP